MNSQFQLLLTVLLFTFSFNSLSASKKTYQIITDSESAKGVLHGTIDHPLIDFTLCHWSRRNIIRNDWEAIFSYDEASFRILVRTHSDGRVYFSDGTESTAIETHTKKSNWIHICSTWTSFTGSRAIFINGNKKIQKELGSRSPIGPNGTVTLGLYKSSRPHSGQIAEVHLWDYILTPKNISDVFACTFPEGNIIGWNQRIWRLYNGAMISIVELPCAEI